MSEQVRQWTRQWRDHLREMQEKLPERSACQRGQNQLPTIADRSKTVPDFAVPKMVEKEQRWSITGCDYQTNYKTVGIKTVWYRHVYRQTDEWDRTESGKRCTQKGTTNF